MYSRPPNVSSVEAGHTDRTVVEKTQDVADRTRCRGGLDDTQIETDEEKEMEETKEKEDLKEIGPCIAISARSSPGKARSLVEYVPRRSRSGVTDASDAMICFAQRRARRLV